MKKLVFLVTALLCVATTVAGQPKSKSKQKEAPPTQAEMAEMMKEMQSAMDGISPEDKRAMDSLGIKMPDLKEIQKSMSGVSDAQLKQAYEDESRIVPAKEVNRIASISKTPLTNATLPAFLSTTHGKVSIKLKPASKAKGEEIYKALKAQYKSPVAIGNAAAGLWMMGKVELALYVMGKACLDSPTQTDNLNNYASMLSMSGAEEVSIPVLNYLNKRFRNNSTILNNLGQAWFGLGDIDKANAYLDSTLRLYAYHPQANFTKSLIEESRDHHAAAVEAARRAARDRYSSKKGDRMHKLGQKLNSKDINWNEPMPQDPLGLEKFNWPAYPMTVGESEVLEKDWTLFKDMCRKELATLEAQQKKLEAETMKANQKRMNEIIAASQHGKMVNPMPALAEKAIIKLGYLVDDSDGHLSYQAKTKGEALAKALMETAEFEDILSKRLEEIEKKYEDEFGEGRRNPMEEVCALNNKALNEFLKASNTRLNQATKDYLNFLRKKLNDEVYYNQYVQWPDQFELTKVMAKITWLHSIQDQRVQFKNKGNWCNEVEPQKQKQLKLAAFDDVHCMYHSSFTTPVGTMRMDCSRWTTELDLKVIKLGLKQDMDKETFGDQFMSCSVEIGASAGAGVNAGPLKAEASIGGSIKAEFDRNGLSDVILKSSAGVSVGTDIIEGGSMAGVGVSDVSVEVGIEGQISLISGASSVSGTGLLE